MAAVRPRPSKGVQGSWLTVWSRKRDGTLYNEPSKRGKKAEPQDPPPAGPVAVGAPAPVHNPPPPLLRTCPTRGPGPLGLGLPWNLYPPPPAAGTPPPANTTPSGGGSGA